MYSMTHVPTKEKSKTKLDRSGNSGQQAFEAGMIEHDVFSELVGSSSMFVFLEARA